MTNSLLKGGTILALAATIFGAIVSDVMADGLSFRSGQGQTRLIELYTSEGCSSCPPAEAWVDRLKADPGLWKDFVPLAFHVDYWDYLGWRDRFSSATFTERQRRYAALLGTDSIYTPEFILNGKEWLGWSNGHSFSGVGNDPVGVLSAEIRGDNLLISFSPAQKSTAEWDAHAALLVSGVQSKIGAGENRGRTLEHNFVVLDHQEAPLKKADTGDKTEMKIPRPALKENGQGAIAVWVTERNRLVPIQATGGWLSER